MRVMLLAAGRGERLRPLTDSTPKPLVKVHGQSLIEHHIERLTAAGFREFVINYAWLGEKIVTVLGDGKKYGARITYSPEPDGAFETGGGIAHALPILGEDAFLVVNTDIWTDYPFAEVCRTPTKLAHLVMVDTPAYRADGDFVLTGDRMSAPECTYSGELNGGTKLTFSGIGVYRPELFKYRKEKRFPLGPLLKEAMARDEVTGEHYPGVWVDAGTPERLKALNTA